MITLLGVGSPVRCRITSGPAHRPAAVLLHGAGSSHGSWQGVQDELEGKVRSIAFDRYALPPAQGLSGHLHQVLEAVGWAPPYVLVGHSWGGAIARSFAQHRPADVAALVLADATHEDLRELSRLPFRLVRAAARLRGGPAGREIAAIPRDLRTLRTTPVPTVALTGTAGRGRADRRRRGDMDQAHQTWAARHDNVRHVRVDGVGHDLPGRASAVLAAHILATLDSVVEEPVL